MTNNLPDERSAKVVALLDILGFESQLAARGLDKLIEDYRQLEAVVDSVQGMVCVMPVPNGDGTFSPAVGFLAIDKAYFSDTIIVWADYDAFKLPAFFQTISELICKSIELQLPLPGAIAAGDCLLSSESGTFVGAPVVEAARAEAAQNWIGVGFGKSFADREYGHFADARTIIPYRRHRKRHNKYREMLMEIVLDWPRHWRQTRTEDILLMIEEMNTTPNAMSYYENTKHFAIHSELKQDWFNVELKRLERSRRMSDKIPNSDI